MACGKDTGIIIRLKKEVVRETHPIGVVKGLERYQGESAHLATQHPCSILRNNTTLFSANPTVLWGSPLAFIAQALALTPKFLLWILFSLSSVRWEDSKGWS